MAVVSWVRGAASARHDDIVCKAHRLRHSKSRAAGRREGLGRAPFTRSVIISPNRQLHERSRIDTKEHITRRYVNSGAPTALANARCTANTTTSWRLLVCPQAAWIAHR